MNKAYARIVWQNEPSITTPLNETNLNKMDSALDIIDNRVVEMDTTKANQSDLLQSLKTVTYNDNTGVFTFTFWNDTTLSVDLNIEKIPVSFSMSPQGVITMTTADGTTYTADVAELIKTYTFTDSGEIDFTVTTDASGNKTVTAGIVSGSITANKLQPNFLADCESAKDDAESAATSASNSALNSNASAEDSEAWAVGERDGVPVPSTDPAYQNNAKYWSQQANPTLLENLSDTQITSPTNGQALIWDDTLQKWKNGAGGGGASLPIDISDNVNNVTGILKTANGGTGNSDGYIRTGVRSGGSTGLYSTVEGHNNVASGGVSHAEGDGCSALGLISHAEGNGTMASGNFSHAEGQGTLAAAHCQHAEGKWNEVDSNNTYAHIVGNGTDTNNRLNIHTLDWNGNAWFAGNVTDGSGNKLSDVANKHKVSNFEVSTTGWTSDTTSQSGTTLYKKQVSLSHVYANPSVDIGASTGNVLPTTAEQSAYDLVQYVTFDDTVPCLYLYASDTPTSAFNIDVEGVD